MSADCGCCDGVQTVTPAPSYNRPGLPMISYRAGTYGRFRESMLARLSSRAALNRLTTREPDDPAIALLDCWALVGDVLTFYQERIANEGYLPTATEPESLTRLGRLVGYAPRPPLGSSTYLAYTLDPGARTVVPAGSGAKSVPAQNELPQTYETTEELAARAEWNTLPVRRTAPLDVTAGAQGGPSRFGVAGVTANLQAGDRLLFLFGTAGTQARVVKDATPDFLAGTTAVTLASDAATDEFAAALARIQRAVAAAAADPPGPFAIAVKDRYLGQLGSLSTPESVFTGFGTSQGLPGWLDALREEGAIARVHEGCAVRRWFDTAIKEVLDAGDALVTVATALTRRGFADLAELRQLARDLRCPPCEDSATTAVTGRGVAYPDPDCDRAAALVALTPVLPWLRREPSRPPRRARDVDTKVEDVYQPDSDVHPKLLIAADPRLRPNLHRAWANEQIAPPIRLAGLQVMRIKATVTGPPPDGVVIESGTGGPTTSSIWLDAIYDAILPGSWVVADTAPLRVAEVRTHLLDVRSGDGATLLATVPVTELVVEGTATPAVGTGLWALGAELTPIGDPITTDVGGSEIELDGAYDGLAPGRWLVVSGERTDVPHTSGVQAGELVMLAGVRQRVDPARPGDALHSTLLLANELAYTYRRDTVVIHGNVVGATQGESRTEVLGSGDSGQAGQVFRLRQVLDQTPLTWLPADNPLGAQDSLTTRVGGVAWHETDGLVWSGPQDHSYVVRFGVDRSVSVAFGDGVYGARLPSGTDNVTAQYRTGAGRSGNVAAGQISQLASRPLGVSAVTNPLPATGGADGDGPGDARVTTPLRMLALDRLVSVRDYQDFTRARAGIGKASAARLFDGEREVVHVTIAGIGDVPIDQSSELFGTLESALTDFGDPGVPVRVSVRDLVLLVLKAGIKVLPDYDWDRVEPAVRAAVLAAFGFTARELGEPAYLSSAISVMQAVPGVDYVDVDLFHGLPGDVTPVRLATIVTELTGADPCVPASPARYEERFATVPPGGSATLTAVARSTGRTVDELVRLNPGLRTPALTESRLTVFRGIRPAQLAVLPADLPEALILRRIP